ncbi:hypothetical protein F5I97DRAFT_1831641 [Phlebopus sp. FC_14]|nr:hypothetical protein F5I97DRAFT_1831641 [Phlebopus sp. FC_14]
MFFKFFFSAASGRILPAHHFTYDDGGAWVKLAPMGQSENPAGRCLACKMHRIGKGDSYWPIVVGAISTLAELRPNFHRNVLPPSSLPSPSRDTESKERRRGSYQGSMRQPSTLRHGSSQQRGGCPAGADTGSQVLVYSEPRPRVHGLCWCRDQLNRNDEAMKWQAKNNREYPSGTSFGIKASPLATRSFAYLTGEAATSATVRCRVSPTSRISNSGNAPALCLSFVIFISILIFAPKEPIRMDGRVGPSQLIQFVPIRSPSRGRSVGNPLVARFKLRETNEWCCMSILVIQEKRYHYHDGRTATGKKNVDVVSSGETQPYKRQLRVKRLVSEGEFTYGSTCQRAPVWNFEGGGDSWTSSLQRFGRDAKKGIKSEMSTVRTWSR